MLVHPGENENSYRLRTSTTKSLKQLHALADKKAKREKRKEDKAKAKQKAQEELNERISAGITLKPKIIQSSIVLDDSDVEDSNLDEDELKAIEIAKEEEARLEEEERKQTIAMQINIEEKRLEKEKERKAQEEANRIETKLLEQQEKEEEEDLLALADMAGLSIIDSKSKSNLNKKVQKKKCKKKKKQILEGCFISKKKQQEENQIRSEAFDILANQDRMQETLVKTQMCKFTLNSEECKHGTKCRYAHTYEELGYCRFMNECKRISSQDGVIINYGDKKCDHKHPGESEENFYVRTGLKKPEKKPEKKVETEVVCTPKKVCKSTPAPWAPMKVDKTSGRTWADIVSPSSKPTSTPTPTSPIKKDENQNPWKTVQKNFTSKKEKKHDKLEFQSPKTTKSNGRLCKSVTDGVPCPHGKNCRFTHTVTEHNDHKSKTKSNGRLCKSVTDGVPCPHGENCRFIHTVTEHNDHKSKPIEVTKTKKVKKSKPVKKSSPKSNGRLCKSVTDGVTCPHGENCRFSHDKPLSKEIIISVPKELAAIALEMAMKNDPTKSYRVVCV